MKYVMTWTPRLSGSAEENEAATRRGLELFSKWHTGGHDVPPIRRPS